MVEITLQFIQPSGQEKQQFRKLLLQLETEQPNRTHYSKK